MFLTETEYRVSLLYFLLSLLSAAGTAGHGRVIKIHQVGQAARVVAADMNQPDPVPGLLYKEILEVVDNQTKEPAAAAQVAQVYLVVPNLMALEEVAMVATAHPVQ
jgi:hypothetical protein